MPGPVEESISDAYFKAFSIQERIKSVYLQTYPSPTPRKLLEFYNNVCTEYQTSLVRLHSEKTASLKDVSREIKLIAMYLCWMASHIRYAEGASVERTPASFVSSWEKLVEKVLPRAKLIVRPQWRYNFKIINLMKVYRKPISDSLGHRKYKDLTASLGDNFFVISFPGFERDNILVQTVLGHEIGHPIADDFLANEDKGYIAEIMTQVERTLPTTYDPIKKYAEIGRETQEIVEIRTRGLEELISDLVSIYLFNLAALFSNESYCQVVRDIDNFSLDPSHGYYPPWRMRLRLMYEELEFQNIEKTINVYSAKSDAEKHIRSSLIGKLNQIKSVVSTKTDEDNIEKHKYSKIAYASIKAAIPHVKTYLNKRVPKYDLKTRYGDINHYCDRILYCIPPNASEVDIASPKVSDLQSIMIAGWVHKTAHLSSMFSSECSEGYIKNLTTLNKLLSKAMELSDIQKEYQEYEHHKILFRKFFGFMFDTNTSI